jgi:YesN/AraC family two-component response regulator
VRFFFLVCGSGCAQGESRVQCYCGCFGKSAWVCTHGPCGDAPSPPPALARSLARSLAQSLLWPSHRYEKREKEHAEYEEHVKKMITTKGLEVQLAEAKLAKQEQLTLAEKERGLIYQVECKKLSVEQADLIEKLKSTQTTLISSSEVFDKYKTDFDRLHKMNKTLMKQHAAFETRTKTTEAKVVTVTVHNEELKRLLAVETAKASKLEMLCRAMQLRQTSQTIIAEKDADSSAGASADGNGGEGAATADAGKVVLGNAAE